MGRQNLEVRVIRGILCLLQQSKQLSLMFDLNTQRDANDWFSLPLLDSGIAETSEALGKKRAHRESVNPFAITRVFACIWQRPFQSTLLGNRHDAFSRGCGFYPRRPDWMPAIRKLKKNLLACKLYDTLLDFVSFRPVA